MFAYTGTMEYSRGRRTLERTRRVDLDVNYRSPSPDVPRDRKGEGKGVTDRSKERGREGKRGRKEDTDSIASAKPDWTALSSSPS